MLPEMPQNTLQAPEISSGRFKAQILTPVSVLNFYFILRKEPRAPEPVKGKTTKDPKHS